MHFLRLLDQIESTLTALLVIVHSALENLVCHSLFCSFFLILLFDSCLDLLCSDTNLITSSTTVALVSKSSFIE